MANNPIDENSIRAERDKIIFLFIGDQALTLEDLGPAADMPLPEAMQYLVDNGFMDPDRVGKKWYEVISSDSFTLESPPEPEQELSYVLYQKYHNALKECQRLNSAGLPTSEARALMMKLRRDWLSAKKLSTPNT